MLVARCRRRRACLRRRRARIRVRSMCVLMNPPFNDPARQQRVARSEAPPRPCGGADDALALWIGAAARLLRARGILTLIWRADGLADVLSGAGAGLRRDRRCCRFMARPGSRRSACWCGRSRRAARRWRCLPALVLNDAAGRPTAAGRSGPARRLRACARCGCSGMPGLPMPVGLRTMPKRAACGAAAECADQACRSGASGLDA